MISPIIALLSVALASPNAAVTPEVTSRPYVMEKAGEIAVSYAVKYRKSGVPEEEASSAASELVNSVLDQPQATAFVKSAVSYFAEHGPTINGDLALQAATKASSFYDQVATKPAYTAFVSKVAMETGKFDLQRAASDAQNLVVKQAQAHGPKANKALFKANSAYYSVAAEPNGQKAIETGKAVAGKVAADFNIDTHSFKANVARAKTSMVMRMISF